MPNLADLESLARAGLLSSEDIMRAYAAIGALDRINSEARQLRDRRVKYGQVVRHYAESMAPRFGIEASLPRGDWA